MEQNRYIWWDVKDKMPESRVRVIGSCNGYTVGDIYWEKAGQRLGLYDSANEVEMWRYSNGNNPVQSELIPDRWTDLPLFEKTN